MFKTKEYFLEAHEHTGNEYERGYDNGIGIAFKSFAERVEFYKKYRNHPVLLQIHENKIFKEFYNIVSEELRGESYINWFNNWLFDYCFGDIE